MVEVELPPTYPTVPPSISADVPYSCQLQWSAKSRLKDVICQFSKHLEKLQDFWSTLSEIDQTLLVIDPKQPSHGTSYRQISLGNDAHMLLSINVHDPKSLPECRFLAPDSVVDSLRKKWMRNCRRWRNEKSFSENLETILELVLPGPPRDGNHELQVDCGICYAVHLPVDSELGHMSGSETDYICDNRNCSKAFHSLCLWDWLRSISTTRQSFNVLFGNCPYCSEAVVVKVNGGR